MKDPKTGPPRDDLKNRIESARTRYRERDGAGGARRSYTGLGLGVRITAEIISALAVGVVLGLVLDTWLETRPLFLIGGFLLGSGAAFLNLMRIAKRVDEERNMRRRSDNGGADG